MTLDVLNKKIEKSISDLYNKKIRDDGISITILEPHHNKMRVVHPPRNGKLLVRKYSVKEHFRLMGFTDEKLNFGNQSYQQLCKMAANGWDISLTAKIFKQIFNQKQRRTLFSQMGDNEIIIK